MYCNVKDVLELKRQDCLRPPSNSQPRTIHRVSWHLQVPTHVSMKRRTPSKLIESREIPSSPSSNARAKPRFRLFRQHSSLNSAAENDEEHNDRLNYALLIALYTLQGIPMGLSASIPFLIQQKVKLMALAAASAASSSAPTAVGAVATSSAALSYNANAIFALCSWPFSLKLLWAPLVDSIYFRGFGRRKSWLVPVQALAGLLMVAGSGFIEGELGLGGGHLRSMNVKGVTAFFFGLYFLMATQDIAVDGWALTMLSKANRGRGPVCNSIGQNIGYFLSFVGFLALNDAETSEQLWRPLLRLPSKPEQGIVSLGGFIRFMGYFMLVTTSLVAVFKREGSLASTRKAEDPDDELDSSQIGLRETYHRLWAVCKLPAVQWLFLILFTYRLPTALSDNVKFLRAVELGLSKSATALLSPTIILPLGIIVPIVATKVWHGHPLRQFMTAYQFRVTLIPLLDVVMLKVLKAGRPHASGERLMYWSLIVLSTAAQAIVNSLQFNAQMTFFAHRVDPAIGGSYMTLLNTAANLGGTWPASAIMWLMSRASNDGERDPYFSLQLGLSVLGVLWIVLLGHLVHKVAALPDDAWRTHLLDDNTDYKGYDEEALRSMNVELGGQRYEDKHE